MVGKEVIRQRPLTLLEVKKILTDRKKSGEMNYEQKVVLDYSKEFSNSTMKKIDTVLGALIELGIPEEIAVKLVNVQPTSKEEVQLMFERVRFDLKEDQIPKILDLIKDLWVRGFTHERRLCDSVRLLAKRICFCF